MYLCCSNLLYFFVHRILDAHLLQNLQRLHRNILDLVRIVTLL